MHPKGKTITDVLASLIEERFEASHIDHPCTRSRHITQLLRCPYFMNHAINYTKDKDTIMRYVREYIQKVHSYLYKKSDEEDEAIVQSVFFEDLDTYIETHPSFQLFFGLHLFSGKKHRTSVRKGASKRRSVKKAKRPCNCQA